MKALSLWQPWASLIAVGGKRVETRHWPAPQWLIGQRIAIHAAKNRTHLRLVEDEPFNRYLREPPPLGVIVATAVVDRCARISYDAALELERRDWHEFAFGNYAPGRFAWVLRDVERLVSPIAFVGRQGIFDVPDHLIAAQASAPVRGRRAGNTELAALDARPGAARGQHDQAASA